VSCLHATGVESFEPTLGVAPNGTVFLYPAWQSGELVRVAGSFDAGETWQEVVPSLAGQNPHAQSLDPYLYLDPTTGRVFANDLQPNQCSMFSFTDDQDASWNYTLAGCGETDHQTVFAGPPTVSTTTGYPNVVYRCAANAGLAADETTFATPCARSLDGRATWLPPGKPAFLTDRPAPWPRGCQAPVGVYPVTGSRAPRARCTRRWRGAGNRGWRSATTRA